jgi:hypothetical protein
MNIACDLAGEFVLKVLDSHNCGLLLVNTAEVRLRIYFRGRICKPFKEPRNRFQAGRASTTTLFVVPACQAT